MQQQKDAKKTKDQPIFELGNLISNLIKIIKQKTTKQTKFVKAFIVTASKYFDRCSLVIKTVAAPVAAKNAKNMPIVFRLLNSGPKAKINPTNAIINPTI